MPTLVPPAPRRVLVYEFLSAGGCIEGAPPQVQRELLLQGVAMRDAMLRDLLDLPAVQAVCVTGPDAPLPAWEGCSAQALQPDETPAQLLARAAGSGHLVWAVAPECGGVLEQTAQAVPPAAWLGCSAATIALAGSKRATTRHLAECGIPVPDVQLHGGAGWVVKPDDGAGCADTRWHITAAAAQADQQQRAVPATLEPWVEGDALSASLCCGDDGAELLSINQQHVERDAQGHVHYRGVSTAAIALGSETGLRVAQLVGRVARHTPGLRGFVGIDLVWHAQHGPVVIEINPRLTSAYIGLSAALGVNVAQRLLAATIGDMP